MSLIETKKSLYLLVQEFNGLVMTFVFFWLLDPWIL